MRTWLRFSIRELLLLVVIVALVLTAWRLASMYYLPSAFYQSLVSGPVINSAAGRVGVQVVVSEGSGQESGRRFFGTKLWQYRLKLLEAEVPVTEFVNALEEEIEARLNEADGYVTGRGFTSTGGQKDGFTHSYRAGENEGEMTLRVIEVNSASRLVFFTLVESRR